MKNVRALVALSLLAVFLAGTAEAANTPQVNPNVPAQNSPLQSSTLRANFLAIYNDFTTIFNAIYLGANQTLGSLGGGNAVPLSMPPCAAGGLSWTAGVGYGCNAISGGGSLTSPVTTNPLVFTGAISFNQNAAALPTKQTGTVFQLGNVDGSPTRIESNAYANSAYFSGIRSDGTNAAPTTLQNNDEISGINAWGYAGSAVVGPRASVREYAAMNWTTTGQGTYVDIATTLNNTTTMNESVRFENDGGMTLPATVTGGDMGPATINANGFYKNGVAVLTAIPSQGPNTVLGAVTTGSPAALAMNSCSGASNALTWITGTGFGCNTISGGGGSGTVNSGTAGQIGVYSATGTAISGSALATLTTGGIALNGLNAASLPDNGLHVTSIAVGPAALAVYSTTTGTNTAVGYNAATATTTAADTVAIGANALKTAISDSRLTAVGSGALQSFASGNTTTSGLVAVGYQALKNDSTGQQNTALGYQAGDTMSIAGTSIMIGYQAGHGYISGSNNIAIGNGAFHAAGGGGDAGNIIIGTGAGVIQTGGSTIIIGDQAGVGMNSGSSNCIGGAACGLMTGVRNVVNGNAAGGMTTGTNNVEMGTQVGNTFPTTGSFDILIGGDSTTNAALANTSTAIGIGTGAKPGSFDTAVGILALSATITNGNDSAAFGYKALAGVTTGIANTALGYQAGDLVTVGGPNTVLGANVGSATLVSGSNNILIGTSSAVDTPAAGTNKFLNIGNGVIVDLNAPTVSSGFGTSPTIPNGTSNGAFTVNVGTGGSATSGVIAFTNAAAHGWACDVTDSTTTSSTVFVTKSVPTSVTTVTFTNYNDTGTAAAWAASDVLVAKCKGY